MGELPSLTAPEKYVDLAVGGAFLAGVTSSGRALLGTGSLIGEPVAPPGSDGFVAVKAAQQHAFFETRNGDLIVTGSADDGGVVPPGLDLVGYAGGYRNSVFLEANGAVSFAAPDGHTIRNLPDFYDGEHAAVSAGRYYTMALDERGGLRLRGAIPNSETSWATTVGAELLEISAGDEHAVGISRNGALVGMGHAEATDFSSLPAGESYAAVAAGGGKHSLVLTTNGVVRAVGHNDQGQATPPPLLPGARRWTDIAAGTDFSLALTDTGRIQGFGKGFTTAPTTALPELPRGASHWVAVDAGGEGAIALADNGVAVAFGAAVEASVPLPDLDGANRIVAVAIHGHHVAVLGDHGEVSNGFLYRGARLVYTQTEPDPPVGYGYVSLDAGAYHVVALARPLVPLTGMNVAVTGTPVVEGVLKANVTGAAQADPITGGTSVHFQWFADGEEVASGSSDELMLFPDMAGKEITVRARLMRFEHEITHLTASAPARVALATQTPPTLTVEGEVKSGQQLRGRLSEIDARASVSWSWKRGNNVVATRASYVPSEEDAGQPLHVTATVERRGYHPASVVASTGVVKSARNPATFKVSAPKSVRSQMRFKGPAAGLQSGEQFTARFGKQTAQGVADAQGVARFRFLAPLKNRALRLQVRVTGASSDRLGVAPVRVLGRRIAMSSRRAVVSVGDRQSVTIQRLGKRERVVLVRGGKRVKARANSKGVLKYRFTVRKGAGVKKLKVIASRSDRTATVRWRVRR